MRNKVPKHHRALTDYRNMRMKSIQWKQRLQDEAEGRARFYIDRAQLKGTEEFKYLGSITNMVDDCGNAIEYNIKTTTQSGVESGNC